MPPPVSSSVQAARQRLADQLKEIREDAGLTGRELARRAGWTAGVSKVSRIEHAVRPISAEDLRTWCEVCGVPEQRTGELIAELRAVASMWASHRQLNRAGLKGRQERLRDEYWQLRLNRTYQTRVFPGLLQTAAMMRFYLSRARQEQHLELDDVAEAVAARLDRQRCLDRPDARWLFLLEEEVLWYRCAPAGVHREQLEHLRTVRRRPSVVLGIIPRGLDRAGVIPAESFTVTDDAEVSIELTSGYLRITQPGEIRLYLEAWDRLHPLAVYGDRAEALIGTALQGLDQSGELA